jgi:phosphoserine phosphatase
LLLKERLDEEVSLAREIQMSTLPNRMPKVPGYEVYGRFLPTQQTGGDTFDLVMLEKKLFLLMADATGHGFGPALSATQLQAMLRVAFRCGVDLATAYCQVNNQLTEDLPVDRFVTAFMGFLNPVKHELEYYSGGQGPILFFSARNGECEWREPTSFPLGVMELESPGAAQQFSFEQGDVLALLSDGIYEFLNEQQAGFGQQRVAQWLLDYHQLTAAEMGTRLLQELTEFAGDADQADDVTAVIIKRS